MPFAQSPRLIVEGKATRRVGLPIIRNAAGVLKDINERYVPAKSHRSLQVRHHYNYAVFTTGQFAKDAVNYGFAQDIFLFPYARDGVSFTRFCQYSIPST